MSDARREAEAVSALRREAPAPAEGVNKVWFELREPGCVPERKGAFPISHTKQFLRELMDARPNAFISVVTIGSDGPGFEDGPQCLEILDGRYRVTAQKHRSSSAAAFAARTDTAEARLREALERIASDHTQYDWPIDATSGEAMTHVAVQMREIARQALSPPSGGDEGKESEGRFQGSLPSGESDPTVTLGCRPSEPSPPADRREIVARIINTKVGSKADPNFVERRWLTGVDEAADAILAALDGGR